TPTIAPASAPASAFSRSVSALDTGSDAACFAGGSLDSSVSELALASVAAVSAGAALFDGVAARDCASAAEKSSVTTVGVVVVLVEEVEVAADARVACRPDRESPVGLSDRGESFVGDLELAELEPAECEPAECELADCALPEWELPLPGRPAFEGPRAEGCAAFGVEASAFAGLPLLPLRGLEAAGGGGLVEVAIGEGAGAGEGAGPGTGREFKVSMESAAMGECPAGPELLRALVGFLLLGLLRCQPLLGLPVGCEVADRRRAPGCIAPALELCIPLQAALAEDLRLMAQRLIEAAEEYLILAYAGAVHAGFGAAGEIPHVGGAVGLELIELRLRCAHVALAFRQRFRLAALVGLDDTPNHADALSLLHLACSERTSLSAARLAARLTCSRMSCCRNRW